MSASVISLGIQVDGEATFKSAISSLDQQIKAMGAGIEAATAQMSRMGEGEAAASQKTQLLGQTIDANKQKLQILQQQYEAAKAKLNDLATAMDRAKQSGDPAAIDRATNAYNKQAGEVAKLEGSMAKTETAIAKASTSMDEMATHSDKAGAATDELSGNIQKKLVAEALGNLESKLEAVLGKLKEFASGFVDLVKGAAQYETAFAKVKTLADETSVSYDQLSADILALSDATGVAAEDIAESVYQALSGGIQTADVVEAVATATRLATGGFTDSAAAVDILTTALNAYKLDASQANEVADRLITTQNLGKTSVADLAANMGRVIPIAAAANVNLDNLSAAYAILTANGNNTANSTTYLAAMLNELTKEGSNVATVIQEQTGQSFSQLMASGASLDDVLQILMQSVNGDIDAFKNLWGSQTAGLSAVSLVQAGTEKYNATLNAMQESAGNAQAAYDTMSGTFEHKSAVVSTSFENLKTSLMQNLQEPINKLMDIAISAMEKVKEWASSAKAKAALEKVGDKVGELVTKLGDNLDPIMDAVIGLFDKAVEIVGFLSEHMNVLIGIVGGLTGAVIALKVAQLALNVAMLANPIGQVSASVIAAVAVVAAAAVAIVKHWDEIRNGFIKAWEAIKAAWSVAVDFFKGIWDGICNAFASVGAWFADIFGKAWSGIQSAWSGVTGWFQDIWDKIVSTFAELPGKMLDIGKNIVRGIWDGISNTANWLWDQLKGWMGGVVDGIKGFLGIHSPSTVFAGIGTNMGLGLARGITSTESVVERAMRSIIPDASSMLGAVDPLSVASRSGSSLAFQDNRPIIIKLDDREFGRAVRGYA